MKFTIETTDINEAMAILGNLENKVEAPAQEVKTAEAKAEVKETVHKAEAKTEAAATSHDDELANKRSEAAKKAAATKKAKAEAEAKAKADKAAKTKADKAAEEVDPLADLGGDEEDGETEEALDLETVQSALRAALKANAENKNAVRVYFKEHNIVGGVDKIPEELFEDCYKFAQGLM